MPIVQVREKANHKRILSWMRSKAGPTPENPFPCGEFDPEIYEQVVGPLPEGAELIVVQTPAQVLAEKMANMPAELPAEDRVKLYQTQAAVNLAVNNGDHEAAQVMVDDALKVLISLFLVLFCLFGGLFQEAQAANIKISELPTVTTPTNGDEFPINQAGTTKKITLSQIVTHTGFAAHAADLTIHRSINDGTTTTTNLWSADKISDELATKADTSHEHAAADITSGIFGIARGGTGLSTIASGKLLYASGLDTLAALTLGNTLNITGGTLDVLDSTTTQNIVVAAEYSDVGTRSKINFIEGAGITLTVDDNGVDEEVDITIDSDLSPWFKTSNTPPGVAGSVTGTDNFVLGNQVNVSGAGTDHAFNLGMSGSVTGDYNFAIGSANTIEDASSHHNFLLGYNNYIYGNVTNSMAIGTDGSANVIDGHNEATAMGVGGRSRFDGDFVIGQIPSSSLSAQTHVVGLYASTATTDPTLMGMHNTYTGIPIKTNASYTFRIQVTGQRVGNGDTAAYEFYGAAKNIAGTSAAVGSINKTVIGEDDSGNDCGVTVSNTTDEIQITVTAGTANATVWSATAYINEVMDGDGIDND